MVKKWGKKLKIPTKNEKKKRGAMKKMKKEKKKKRKNEKNEGWTACIYFSYCRYTFCILMFV